MIRVESAELYNVRSHQRELFNFVPTVNAIVGPNGSGKTSLIEALYALLRGSSFRGSLGEMLSYSAPSYQIKISLKNDRDDKKFERSFRYVTTNETVAKKWLIQSKQYARLPLAARLPTVLFEPDLGRLVTGSPERRRQYLDNIASQLDVEVALAQTRFDRILRQRNQLLKNLSSTGVINPPEELFVWNTQLAMYSQTIVSARVGLIKKLQKDITKYYKQLGGDDDVLLTYKSSVSTDPEVYASKLVQFLEAATQRDLLIGHTSFGPHRDELEIRLSDQPAVERASRGEVRTIVIALKLLETEILAKQFSKSDIKPILLLDDVLSELDLVHQERVLAGFKDYQVFLTTTDSHTLTPGTHTLAL